MVKVRTAKLKSASIDESIPISPPESSAQRFSNQCPRCGNTSAISTLGNMLNCNNCSTIFKWV